MLFGEGVTVSLPNPERPAGREAEPKHQRPGASVGSEQGEEKAFLAARRADWRCASEVREVLVPARLRYHALQG